MIEPHATRCAICGSINNDRELFPAPFDESAFNPATFSARRLPGRIHYRMVKYDSLGLITSGPVRDADLPTAVGRSCLRRSAILLMARKPEGENETSAHYWRNRIRRR